MISFIECVEEWEKDELVIVEHGKVYIRFEDIVYMVRLRQKGLSVVTTEASSWLTKTTPEEIINMLGDTK